VVAYCEANNIRYICYDRAKRNGSANFNINQPSPDWSFNQAWERYAERQLTETEEKKVSEYLGERELQKGDVYSYNASAKVADINALKKQLGIPEGRKVITIFTNLIWDAANVARDIAFSSALDCIVATIKKYEGSNEIHVVVRAHPAEKVLGTKERYGNLVREAFNHKLPDNVTIIEPEMEVNSFSVIELSDIGVVNTSTVGLEFAMLGKPIILISETNYRNKGFTFDATSTTHYFELMTHLLKTNKLLPNQVKLSRKYFYMMMFLYQQQMPAVFEGNNFLKYTYPHFNQIPETEDLFQLLRISVNTAATDLIKWK
jgi:CDP-glycerol glycerophosphotransferase (TagB/SpsB family)